VSDGPRIVICTAAVGCGHTRAALALSQAVARAEPTARVRVIEALDLAPNWFVRGYRDAYLTAIAKVPRLAGWLYDLSDRPSTGKRAAGRVEHYALRRFASDPLLLEADLVVTTHFLCARVLSDLRLSSTPPLLRAPLAVCVTDQHPHGIWLVPGADRTLVASEPARQTAIDAGMPAERVVATGIPIDPAFGSFSDKIAARQEMGLPRDKPLILVCGGGLGLGGIEPAVQSLLSQSLDAHVVVVCGKNDELRGRLTRLEGGDANGRPSLSVLGFTTRMAELMGAADVMIGKPGGLTTAEAAASGLAMVLLEPLPGQEERNATNLVGHGAAILQNDPSAAGLAAAELIRNPEALAKMRGATRLVGCAQSAANAAKAVLELLGVAANGRIAGTHSAAQEAAA